MNDMRIGQSDDRIFVLNDEQWARMAPYIVGDGRSRGVSGRNNRAFVEAVLWIVRTGKAWRDLPDIYGKWNSIFRRFRRWSAKSVWRDVFAAMEGDTAFEYRFVHLAIVHDGAAGHEAGLKVRCDNAVPHGPHHLE